MGTWLENISGPQEAPSKLRYSDVLMFAWPTCSTFGRGALRNTPEQSNTSGRCARANVSLTASTCAPRLTMSQRGQRPNLNKPDPLERHIENGRDQIADTRFARFLTLHEEGKSAAQSFICARLLHLWPVLLGISPFITTYFYFLIFYGCIGSLSTPKMCGCQGPGRSHVR